MKKDQKSPIPPPNPKDGKVIRGTAEPDIKKTLTKSGQWVGSDGVVYYDDYPT